MSRASTLRDRLCRAGVMPWLGAADALTARLIERAGFEAVYVTGAGFANASYGIPDIGLVGVDAMTEHLRRIADGVQIPVVVDADTGYGGVLNVARTVRQMERAGASAIQIEDQVSPKRCGHFDGQTVISVADMTAKVVAAVDSREDALIIARTDAMNVEGLSAAVERANAYLAAGADLAFIEAPTSMADLASLPGLVNGPLVANMVEGGKTPVVPIEKLGELGFKVALFANTTMRVAYHAVQKALRHLAQEGSTSELLDEMLEWDERQDLVGLSGAERLENRYYSAPPARPSS